MILQRTIDSNIIRACLTEDKQYCLSNSTETVLYKAIDDVTAQQEALLVEGVGLYRVEMDDGRLAGFCMIKLTELRETVISFTRPSFRIYQQEFDDEVEAGKNSMQRLLVS